MQAVFDIYINPGPIKYICLQVNNKTFCSKKHAQMEKRKLEVKRSEKEQRKRKHVGKPKRVVLKNRNDSSSISSQNDEDNDEKENFCFYKVVKLHPIDASKPTTYIDNAESNENENNSNPEVQNENMIIQEDEPINNIIIVDSESIDEDHGIRVSSSPTAKNQDESSSTFGPLVSIKSDLLLEIEPEKETNNWQLSRADPANIGGQDDMDLDSLPSSQNTIADEEESREYFEAENDQKCENCKMQALRMKIGENRVEHQAKEIKYLKRQRVIEKKLLEEEVKKYKQETISKTEESTYLCKRVKTLKDSFAESEEKRQKLEQDLVQKDANIEEMQRRIEILQRENQRKVNVEMKNKSLEEEKRQMGVLIKGLNSFFEKNKDSRRNNDENIRVNSSGVLTPQKRKNNEN